MGVDVRHDRLEATLIGWTESGVALILGHHVLWGSFEDAELWRDLDELLRQRWPHALGGRIGVDAACVDAGDGASMHRVTAFCTPRTLSRAPPEIARLSKGPDQRQRPEPACLSSESIPRKRSYSPACPARMEALIGPMLPLIARAIVRDGEAFLRIMSGPDGFELALLPADQIDPAKTVDLGLVVASSQAWNSTNSTA